MPETLTSCPLCKSGQFRFAKQINDYSISQEQFSLDQCENCSLLFTNPRPAENEIAPYYQHENYISHTDEGNTLVNRVYKLVRKITLKQKLSLINRLSAQKGKVLDIGCGTGYFLETALNNGWSITGVEVDEHARELANKKLNKQVVKSLSQVHDKGFNIITMWHVLEHVHQLDDYLNTIHTLLNSEGKLILALPNHQSLDAEKYGVKWAGWDVPRHLYHFSPASIKHLAAKYSLTVKEVLPMKFDAFYVSMLSEQYKGRGVLRYPLAIKNGMQSNSKAKKTGHYSSLIYVLSKQNA